MDTTISKESSKNELRIAEIPFGDKGGLIGVTLAPGKKGPSVWGGYHDRDLEADLDVIDGWGAVAVVTLVEDHEFEFLSISDLPDGVRARFMEWHHYPITDVSAPDGTFVRAWPERSSRLRALLHSGHRILIHCRGGLGRAGTVAAQLLIDGGMPVGEAIRLVRGRRSSAAIDPPQERWLHRFNAISGAYEATTAEDRAVGALLGLAVGDAIGTTLEFTAKPALPVLTDLVGGGPFDLEPGQWTDDTAMALALAESLIANPDLDEVDLMKRFVAWWRHGTYSCTGRCFDIGITTRAALARFERTGNPVAGSIDPALSGNGALMRLAPVAVRHWASPDRLADVARRQTITTHGSDLTIEASLDYADLLAGAIAGLPLHEVLARPAAERRARHWRALPREKVRGSGYVVDSLHAALWSVARTTSFESAILLAANLGDDADTTAAIAGQLAGAVYGASNIPQRWLAMLAWEGRLRSAAESLFQASR